MACSNPLLALVLLVLVKNATGFLAGVVSREAGSLLYSIPEQTSPGEDYLSKASKLRQEALEMEQKLRKEKGLPSEPKDNLAPPTYGAVEDSVWTLSYLFSSKPAPKGDKKDEGSPGPRFGGKITVLFKADGFTELVAHEPSKADNAINVVKVWGWDLENSTEDGKDYILFSMDAALPDGKKERFYMQARQEIKSDAIVFQEGTVTIKQDVTQSGSRWGLFSPQGILAEFRYVGDFTARPSRA